MFPSYTPVRQSGKESATPNQFGLNPESTYGGANSLTNYLRSLQNQSGMMGVNSYDYGGGVFQGGLNYTPTAQNSMQTGMDTVGGAVAGLNPVQDYWTSIMQGGPAATAAVSPFASQVSKQLAGATTTAQHLLPRGGYGATVAASLPQQAASQVNNALLSLQPQAAQQLQSLAQTRGQLGGIQAGIGTQQGGLADIIMRGGLGQQQLGQNLINMALQGGLTMRGQDVAEHGQAMGLAGNLGSSALGAASGAYQANQYASR